MNATSLALGLLIACPAALGGDAPSAGGSTCGRSEGTFFESQVWPNVVAARCVQCHQAGGEAEESSLVLLDPRKLEGHARDEAMARNRDAFARMARMRDGKRSRLLVKATGG